MAGLQHGVDGVDLRDEDGHEWMRAGDDHDWCRRCGTLRRGIVYHPPGQQETGPIPKCEDLL